MIRPATLAALVLGAAAQVTAALAAEPFVVGPGDRLSVTVHRRADLSGEFRVLPGGAVSLPFVGNLPVAGRPVDEIRDALAQRLRDDAALLDPRVSVEIAEMQPILVGGGVRRPGQYPFQIGMTVGHALAAAGGMRQFDLEEVGARAEVVRLRERLRQSRDALGIALVRQARLAAEAADKDAFEGPEIARRYLPDERLAQTLGAEREILRRRNGAHNSLIVMISTQTAAYNEEIRALGDQDATKVKESELLKQESQYVDNLMRQGLTPRTNRVTELARFVVQVEGERRQIQAFVARARQEIARLEQSRINAVTSRQLEIATARKDIEDSMTTTRVAIEESRAGLEQLREALPSTDVPVGARPATAVSIVRVRGSAPQRIAAKLETELMPGDLVDVSSDDSAPGRQLASRVGR